jgi:RNA polymerase sigma factor (sigma-70 family)
MASSDPTTLAAQLRRMATAGVAAGLPDAELVRRYVERRDEAAFEVLVWRHGPMVLAACRRVLRHHQDAEDAFQAAFLALSRFARSVGGRGSVAGWLHRVAVNAALKVRQRRAPGSVEVQSITALGEEVVSESGELAGVVDEELNRLPDYYRAAFVLCCLEGKSNAEAASELGCPIGTVDSRLHAARSRLQKGITRRGLAPVVLAGLGVATVPESLSAAAIGFGLGAAAPATIDQLANHAGGTMTRRTLIVGGVAAATVTLAGAAAWALASPPKRTPTSPITHPSPDPLPSSTAERGPALLFTEMVLKPGETGSRRLRLVRLEFKDGKPGQRVELHEGDASEFGFQSKYRLIDDRYVVFESATVVDAVENKVLRVFDGCRVLRVEGKCVFHYCTQEGADSGIYCYDITTGKREKVAGLGEGRWGLRGAVSPDGTKAILAEFPTGSGSTTGTDDGKGGTTSSTSGSSPTLKVGDEFRFNLVLQQVGKKRTVLGEFGWSCGATGSDSMPVEPPGLWLDNERFLTQASLGKLAVVNTTENKTTKLLDVPATFKKGGWAYGPGGAMGFTKLGHQQPRFWMMPDGRVVYEVDELFIVDVAKKTWAKSAWRPLGHGFDCEVDPDRVHKGTMYFEPVVAKVRHEGKVIGESGRVWMSTPEKQLVAVTAGHLAVLDYVERSKGSSLGVRVWTAQTGKWETLDGWADTVIGWVK